MNPVTTHRALRQLHQATVLRLQKAGTHFLYSINDDHDLVRELLKPLFQREASTYARLCTRLRHRLDAGLRVHIVSMAVYGSVARGEERPASDIDLVVLVKSERAGVL